MPKTAHRGAPHRGRYKVCGRAPHVGACRTKVGPVGNRQTSQAHSAVAAPSPAPAPAGYRHPGSPRPAPCFPEWSATRIGNPAVACIQFCGSARPLQHHRPEPAHWSGPESPRSATAAYSCRTRSGRRRQRTHRVGSKGRHGPTPRSPAPARNSVARHPAVPPWVEPREPHAASDYPALRANSGRMRSEYFTRFEDSRTPDCTKISWNRSIAAGSIAGVFFQISSFR